MSEASQSISADAMKGIALVNMIVVAVLGTVVFPMFFKHRTVDCVFGEAMAAGVLLVAAVTHLLPEANEYFDDQSVSGAICITTFLALLFIEQIAVHMLTANDAGNMRDECKKEQPEQPEQFASVALGIPRAGSNTSFGNVVSLTSRGSASIRVINSCHRLNFGDLQTAKDTLSISAICLFVALGFHSVIEGVALGSMNSVANLTSMIISISIHKGLAGFALGQTLLNAHYGAVPFYGMVIAFILFSPIGVLIGWSMRLSGCSVFIGIGTSMAAGTFLFISSFELLPRVFEKPVRLVEKLCGLLLGAALLAIVVIVLHGEHAHDHGCPAMHHSAHDDAHHQVAGHVVGNATDHHPQEEHDGDAHGEEQHVNEDHGDSYHEHMDDEHDESETQHA
eukprot:GEMP01024567.1.p1 GENE.GEMP01024567.1~~GEMP01024567.1.p1  ORF type:complete len:394 (+),score=92.88 GEMP01024567.1:114-1295(+)